MSTTLASKPVGFALSVTLLALGACSDGSHECSEKSGTACTWAGILDKRGFNGDGHDRRETLLFFVEDLTFAPDGRAYVLDWNNHRIRRVEADGKFSTVMGTDYEGDGPPGEVDRLPYGAPAGAPGNTVALNHPTDLEFLPDGTLILAAWHNNKIRALDLNTGVVTVVAGNSYGFGGDNVPAYQAVFNQPKAVAVDEAGQIYTVDQRNQRIRLITNDSPRMIHTIAGSGALGSAGDGGPAILAQFGFEAGTTPRPSGSLALRGRELFVADPLNNRIRRIDLDSGIIDTVAGKSGTAGYSGDGGPPMAAQFNFPADIEFGPDGRLYVADRYNGAVRALDFTANTTETVAGNGKPCDPLSTFCAEPKDGVPAREIQLNQPYGIAFDPAGNLYISDTHNSRIVKVAR